jgi:hypothetical protein
MQMETPSPQRVPALHIIKGTQNNWEDGEKCEMERHV